jgi:cell division transport system permease protein
MLSTAIKRVVKFGFVHFWRNGFVSLASILVMTVALLVLASLILTKALLGSTLTSIQDKVDINVYFTKSASEEEILALKKEVESLPEVASISYASEEDELALFRARHENDELVLESLNMIEENPFGASLNIKAKTTTQYEGLALFLEEKKKENTASIIDKINFSRNKKAIDTLSVVTESSKKLGLGVVIFFVAVSLLITFNTIQLTIYMARDEISVMRLVGAGINYIKGPFVVGGVMYGVFSTILTMLILLPITYWAGPYTFSLGTGLNLYSYYISNFLQIFGVILLSGVSIGILSSYLAVKKYLKI